MRLRFHFRTIAFVATLALVTLGIALGNWQTRRAAFKLAQQAELATRSAQAPLVLTGGSSTVPQAFRRVSVRGQFMPAFPIFLDNRPYQGRAGYFLVMPFKIEGADQYVLVARGWLPRVAAEAGRLPGYRTPAGTVTIEGTMRLDLGHVMQLGRAAPVAPNAMLQNLAVADVARTSGLPLLPFFIAQTGPAAAPGQPGESLVRDWPAPGTGAERHQGYAFQWYALAAMAALFFVITGCRREPKPDPELDPQHE